MKCSLLLCFVCWMCVSEAFVLNGKPYSQEKPVMPLLCQSQNARLSAVAGCLRLAAPLLVDDVSMGEKIFTLNCAHPPENAGIEKYMTGGFIEKAIVYKVTAMPAFGDRLVDKDITNVAAYVLKTAKDSWD